MAVIHHTTLTPGKLELLAAWLPRQPWYRAGAGSPELARAGGFRLDDPDGRVGLEFMVVADAATGTAYHVPATYRDSELPGAAEGLIGTAEHGVLGHRWVYDGAHDPVLVAQLVALIQGQAEPQAQSTTDTADPTVTTGSPAGAGPLAASGAATVVSTGEGTEIQVPVRGGGLVVLRINRVLQPGDGPGADPGVSATWQESGGARARGVFATARYEAPATAG
ncbi:MAG TPA: 1,4-alpha-glucan branching protein [Streptosporangiaceae bacterium]|nr:1,4-alpha-glucan branching protein [Streptosporangiaceae bacterium]